jgi:hypothetical protein
MTHAFGRSGDPYADRQKRVSDQSNPSQADRQSALMDGGLEEGARQHDLTGRCVSIHKRFRDWSELQSPEDRRR